MLTLEAIKQSDLELTESYANKLIVNRHLDRTRVSFQANKRQNGFRWFKYKEGFSSDLVRYILRSLGVESGQLLDPFAGSGAALFVAAKAGMNAVGIELLPVGCEIIKARKIALTEDRNELCNAIDHLLKIRPWTCDKAAPLPFAHLRITDGAFPAETARALANYLAACEEFRGEPARTLLRFAAMCVLEEISYTRKDGQYIQWDHRAGRRQG